MTNREFFTAVSALNGIDADLVAFAKDAIAKLDKRNDARKDKPSKTQLANEPIKAKVLDALTDKPTTTTDLAVAVGESTQKVSALVRQLVDEGKAVAHDVKVKGKGACKAYTLAETDAE